MKEKTNQKFSGLLNKYLNSNNGSKAVIGWFYEDCEHILPFGDFGIHAPETTSFQIGSVTKLFTATLAAAFMKEGTLDLQGQVGDYLALDAGSSVIKVVIGDLLTHHSGLPSAPKQLLGKYDPNNPYLQVSKEKLMEYLNTYRKPIKSNSGFQYSNLGFSMIGLILEAVSGKPYEALVKNEICQLLEMNDLWITQPNGSIYLAPGARRRRSEIPRWELNAIAPAGGIDAHIKDMLKFARANIPGNPFYPQCAICHQATHTISKHLSIGLGWLITKHKDIGVLHSHNGATGGFNSFLGIHPQGRFGVVVLTNCSPSLVNQLGLAQDRATRIGYEGLKFLATESYHV